MTFAQFLRCTLFAVLLVAPIPALAQQAVIEKARELEAVREALEKSETERSALENEVASLSVDQTGLNRRLIDTAAQIQAAESQMSALEERLEELGVRQQDMREALRERRDVLAHLIAALQRMGRNPPPALLVHPDDALASIRSAIALGGIVPQMRDQAEALISDLEELSAIRRSIARDRDNLDVQSTSLRREQARLALLMEIKRQKIENDQFEIAAIQKRSEELAKDAQSFEELIARLKKDIATFRSVSVAKAMAEAELSENSEGGITPEQLQSYFASLPKEPEPEPEIAAVPDVADSEVPIAGTGETEPVVEAIETTDAESAEPGPELEIASLDPGVVENPEPSQPENVQKPLENPLIARSDPNRISPAMPFSKAHELLPLPARGTILSAFGEETGLGDVAQGLSIATRMGAQIVAPADGWIVYSGPFRSYRQLLIIDVGEKHHIVLAGFDRKNVELGQFVLAGEPVGAMSDEPVQLAASVLTAGKSQPVLYVEFRNNGRAINPAPWWADRKLVRR